MVESIPVGAAFLGFVPTILPLWNGARSQQGQPDGRRAKQREKKAGFSNT